jgi:hypothetical protein
MILDLTSPDGSGWYKLTTSSQGLVTFKLYGNVALALDRTEFLSSFTVAQLAVDPSFAGGVAVLSVNGHSRARQSLATGALNLQLHRIAQSDLIDEGLVLKAVSPTKQRSTLAIQGLGNTIRFEQAH